MKKLIHTVLTATSIGYLSFFVTTSFLSTMGMCGVVEGLTMDVIAIILGAYLITFLSINK